MDNDQASTNTKKKIVLTGGGTAGHVTPNIALFPRLQNAGFEIHYVGSDNGIERGLVEKFDYVTYHSIPCGKLRRYFSLKNFTDIFRVLSGIGKARRVLKSISPDIVFSKGGFVSVPVVIGARGIAPVVAHESDFTPGLATKISKRYANKICVTFERTKEFIGEKAVYTGSPIRDSLFMGDAKQGQKLTGFLSTKPVILVIGGSLGSVAVNSAVREALPQLLEDYSVVHLCGKGNIDKSITLDGYVQYEYVTDELPNLFALADVVISRAGANAIFELLALRKPSLLIPLPTGRGDQFDNAKYFKDMHYSDVLDQSELTSDRLIVMVKSMYDCRDEYIKAMESDTVSRNGTDNVMDIILKTIRHK